MSQKIITDARTLSNAKYAEGMTRLTRNATCEGLTLAFTTFFKRTTYQCSGSNVEKARIMDKEYYSWEAELQAMWPGILRELATTRPDLVPDVDKMPKTGWTMFQANMLSAVNNCPANPQEERAQRYQASIDTYLRELAKVNGSLPPDTEKMKSQQQHHQREQTASRLTAAAFDPCRHDLTALTMRRLRTWLKN